MHKIILILSIILLAGCSQSFDIQLDPEINVLLSNDSKQKIHLTPKDKEYVILNEWLRTNSSGWHPASGRYPGGVYLKSGSYGIQITETHVIIYSTTQPEPYAIYIQKISGGELGEILNIGNRK